MAGQPQGNQVCICFCSSPDDLIYRAVPNIHACFQPVCEARDNANGDKFIAPSDSKSIAIQASQMCR